MTPVVVLIGPPGGGKTEVGRLVADRLGVTFRDTDTDVEARAGTSVSDIFIDHGEEHFRALEREAVRTALAEHDGVLALGGGAVLDGGTQDLLRDHHVVYLEVGFAEGVKRVGLARDRPLLVGNPRAQFRELLEARRPTYERVANAVVATDEREPAEVAEMVLLTLKERP
ncbi:MAG: shikimate kinase [Streptosporangiales bacterium]|nr:shikimate kinase [Streptosporangiales bacterium]